VAFPLAARCLAAVTRERYNAHVSLRRRSAPWWFAFVCGGLVLGVFGPPRSTALMQQAWTVQVREVVGAGRVLANAAGRSLYVHDGDGQAQTSCDSKCASRFPPLASGSGAPVGSPDLPGELSVFARPDGSNQVAYNDQPLYLYSGDAQPGDTSGDGVDGVWHLARPSTTTLVRTSPLPQTVTFHAYDTTSWQPVSASVAPGAMITWENDTSTAQAVECVQSASSAACPWTDVLSLPPATMDDQGNVTPTTACVTLSSPGVYVFRSTLNPEMSGQILVGAPTAPRPPATAP
jgi:predicted lipoprotein with Yx(FWY)xxD motif/plastocyanin